MNLPGCLRYHRSSTPQTESTVFLLRPSVLPRTTTIHLLSQSSEVIETSCSASPPTTDLSPSPVPSGFCSCHPIFLIFIPSSLISLPLSWMVRISSAYEDFSICLSSHSPPSIDDLNNLIRFFPAHNHARPFMSCIYCPFISSSLSASICAESISQPFPDTGDS